MNKLFLKIRIFGYMMIQGIKSAFQHIFMIFAAVCVIFAFFFVTGSLISVSLNMQNVIDTYSDRPEIRVNFESHMSEAECKNVAEMIKKDYRVENVTFISEDENFKAMVEYFDDADRKLISGYENNDDIRYCSIDIELVNPTDGESLVKELAGIDGVDNVRNILDSINKLNIAKLIIRVGSIFAAIVLGLLAALLVMNTIKLSVIARHSEIEIMRYIGATKGYITGPFVFEGVLMGLVGAIFSYIALSGIYNSFYDYFTTHPIFGDAIKLLTYNEACWFFLPMVLVIGIGLGIAMSLSAIKRYVKV